MIITCTHVESQEDNKLWRSTTPCPHQNQFCHQWTTEDLTKKKTLVKNN